MKKIIIELRKAFHLNQDVFGKHLTITGALVSRMERGENTPSHQTANFIVSQFNVNSEWLRTGNGSVIAETDASLLVQLPAIYNLCGVEQSAIASFLWLFEKMHAVIFDFVKATVARIVQTKADELRPNFAAFASSASLMYAVLNANVEAYRQELLTEKRATSTSDPSAITGAYGSTSEPLFVLSYAVLRLIIERWYTHEKALSVRSVSVPAASCSVCGGSSC